MVLEKKIIKLVFAAVAVHIAGWCILSILLILNAIQIFSQCHLQ